MWLWNRWLGQPTKREADKNRTHKHTPANTGERRLRGDPPTHTHAHTGTNMIYDLVFRPDSILS